MIRHIVMWKFRPGREAEMHAFLDGLRGLYGVIPQIREQEVGVSCAPGGYDAALISVFESLEDLEAYKKDPRHAAVSALCKAIRTDRVAVDYEV
ncbi:MAG: Dabb family protein [Oscillibacter sp.]|nr:Dabb family protein [Oscillibacter sp.]